MLPCVNKLRVRNPTNPRYKRFAEHWPSPQRFADLDDAGTLELARGTIQRLRVKFENKPVTRVVSATLAVTYIETP